MESIDIIVDELNPMKDMNVVKEASKPLNLSNNSFRKNRKIFLSRYYTLLKPIVRGGSSGAGVGALASLIAGSDVSTGASYGASIGIVIDCAHYYPRVIYHSVKSIFE